MTNNITSNNNLLVSVVIPVYNAEKYLFTCLDSIRKQTYANLEIICVDDGSSDNSYSIIKSFADIDDRFQIIKQANKGPSAARNEGIRNSNGEWISFIDADDWVEPDMFSKMINAVDSDIVDIVICNHTQHYENNHQSVMGTFNSDEDWDKARINIEIRKFLCKGIKEYRPYVRFGMGAVWAKLYRRMMIVENNIYFPENVKSTEDGIFNLYAFEHSKKIKYLITPFYHYRNLCESLSHRYNPDIVSNIEEDFKETIKFANIYKKEDEIFQKGISVKICTWFYRYLADYYYCDQTLEKLGYLEVRKEIKQLLDSSKYKQHFETADLKLMRTEQKIFVFIMKQKLLDLAFLMVRMRKILKKNLIIP